MNELREKITDFIFMRGEVRPCDVIFCAGTSYASIPEYAARLYLDGIAPMVFVGGKYSIKTGHFTAVKDKGDVYVGNYTTEAEFYRDVLLKNGVPKEAIFSEEMSTYTKENAVYARELATQNGFEFGRALLLCHSFHTRRAYMYYRLAFPQTEIIPIGIPFLGLTRDNWQDSPEGVERVMGEIKRIGEQFTNCELEELLK